VVEMTAGLCDGETLLRTCGSSAQTARMPATAVAENVAVPRGGI
jgi:hypothetical protein